MNDEELGVAVKESIRGAHMNIPLEQIVHRSRALRSRRRIPALAVGFAAAATATTTAALVLTSAPGSVPVQHVTAGHTRTVVTAAWTVDEDADGTVTIYLRQYADPAGLQRTLRADGINAIVHPIPSVVDAIQPPVAPLQPSKPALRLRRPACFYATTNNAPMSVQHAVVTVSLNSDLPAAFIIHPDAMPHGSALFLTFLGGMPASLKNDNTGVMALPPVVLNNDTLPACLANTKGMPQTTPKASTLKPPPTKGT